MQLQWQPIEKAPKKGWFLIAWRAEDSEDDWDIDLVERDGPKAVSNDEGIYWLDQYEMFWMPLPEPPK